MWRGIASTAVVAAIAWAVNPGIAAAQPCTPPGAAATPCASADCAVISVGSVNGAPASTVQIPISFTQGMPNGMKAPEGEFDKVAAIAFTLGISGDSSTPLTFDCTNGPLVPSAVSIAAANASDFTVVVENEQCNNSRSRCLCPDTNAGQTRDNFVNLVVYGPKNLPPQGSATPAIPILKSGSLLTLTMQVAQNAPSSIPLHIYSALDTNPATPHFGANLSIGDQGACDVTANGHNRCNVAFTPGSVAVGTGPVGSTPTAPPTVPQTVPPTVPGTVPPTGQPTPVGSLCVGDCNHDKVVNVNELITGVNIVLGTAPPSACLAFEDQNGMVAISQLIKGVNNLLNGCPTS
jgi:hypothetical protein